MRATNTGGPSASVGLPPVIAVGIRLAFSYLVPFVVSLYSSQPDQA